MSDFLGGWKYSFEMMTPSDRTDHELLAAFVNDRCEGSFTSLVQRYVGLVHGIALRTLDHSSQRDDVGQLTFLQLAKKAPQLLRHQHLAGWLHKTAYQQALNLNRGQRRAQAKHLRYQQEKSMSQNSEKAWLEIAPLIDRELSSLKEGDRAILVKRFFAGYSIREVALDAGISAGAAEKRLQRALTKLRDRLNSRGAGFGVSAIAAALLLGGSQNSLALTATSQTWAEQALLLSKKSPSFFSSLFAFIVMKKALSLIMVILLLSLWWTKSSWLPYFIVENEPLEVVFKSSQRIEDAAGSSLRGKSTSRSAVIRGVVSDRITGEPLAGAEIECYQWDPENKKTAFEESDLNKVGYNKAVSNSKGEYLMEITNVDRPLKFSMQVSRRDYSEDFIRAVTDLAGVEGIETDYLMSSGFRNGTLHPGAAVSFDFQLIKATPIRGVVTNEDGEPIQGVWVNVWGLCPRGNGGTIDGAHTDQEGRFTAVRTPASLPSGRLEIKFSHPDYASSKLEDVHLMSGNERLVIEQTLDERNLIGGMVFDEAGKPASRVKVRVHFKSEDPEVWERSYITHSDHNGRYHIKLIKSGKYEVTAINFVNLASFEGEVEIKGEGEMDIRLVASTAKRMEEISLFEMSLTPLASENATTFYNSKAGGLLVNRKIDRRIEMGMLSNPLEKGSLIVGAVDFDQPYSREEFGPILDLRSLVKDILSHIKNFDDGTAAAKIRISLGDQVAFTVFTLRLSKGQLTELREIVKE